MNTVSGTMSSVIGVPYSPSDGSALGTELLLYSEGRLMTLTACVTKPAGLSRMKSMNSPLTAELSGAPGRTAGHMWASC